MVHPAVFFFLFPFNLNARQCDQIQIKFLAIYSIYLEIMISLKSPRNQKLTFRGFWCERFSRKSIYKLVLCPHNDRIVSNVLAISQSSQKQTKFIFLSNDFLLVMVKFMRVHSTVHFVYVCYTPLPRPLRSEQSEGVLLGESGESPPVRCPEPSRSNFPACTLKRSNSFDSMLNCSL